MSLITVKEAAKMLDVTPHYIRKLFRENKIAGAKTDGTIKIDPSSLKEFKKTDEFQDDLQKTKLPMRITIQEAVENVEDFFESDVLSYVSSGSSKASSILPDDCIMLDDQLQTLTPKYKGVKGKKFKKITLFLHSGGGIMETAIKMVDVIDYYSNHFDVIVPLMAKSAASLICLSSENLYLTTIAELGPIDPIIQSPTNPDLMVPARSVDEFIDYCAEQKDNAQTENTRSQDPEIREILLKKLEKAVDPYLLGSQKSALKFSKDEVEKRLKNKIADKENLGKAIDEFTTKNASHSYPITFRKLKELKIKGVHLIEDDKTTMAVKALLAAYQDFMSRNGIVKIIGNRDINRNVLLPTPQKQIPTRT